MIEWVRREEPESTLFVCSMFTHLLVLALAVAVPGDTARLTGSTLIVEPAGIAIDLPAEWFGAKDTVEWLNCGHAITGTPERRFATTRPMLDSLRNAPGEWDHEYSAVVDSILPFGDLVAQVGPQPFGGGCFADLQMRVYLAPGNEPALAPRVAKGVAVAHAFFPSASLAAKDSAQWHLDRIQWYAFYYDYGGDAIVDILSAPLNGRTLILVFMYTPGSGPANQDRRFILGHIRGVP